MAVVTVPWRRVEEELDAWTAVGRVAEFWWRDDDAAAATPAFLRLLDMHRRTGVPLAVAAVPGLATPDLAAAVEDHDDVSFLQHGYLHVNHAAPGEKKAELGLGRELAQACRELRTGRDRMAGMFGGRWVADVLVPPWNRIGGQVAAALPELGFRRLSLFGRRKPEAEPAGVVCINTHVDIVDWRGGGGFVGDEAATTAVAGCLAAIRAGGVGPAEAIGLLTHHAVHDERCWDFVGRLSDMIAAHPSARWRRIADLQATG